MNDLKDILYNIISNNETIGKPENLTNTQDIYKIFVKNGYVGSYEHFEKDLMDFFLESKMTDQELEKISGGKSQKVNRLLAGMFSALTISNPVLNISAATVNEKASNTYSPQETKATKTESLFDKVTAFFKSNTGKNVAAGSALGTPLLALAISGLYKHFTGFEHKFSQIIDYCLKNKDSKQSLADQRHKNILKEILNNYIDFVQKRTQPNVSTDGDASSAEQQQNKLQNLLTHLQALSQQLDNDLTIEKFGEIATDDSFELLLINSKLPKLAEFLSKFHKDVPNSQQTQLDQIQQELQRAQQDIRNKEQEIQQMKGVREANKGLASRVAELNNDVTRLTGENEQSKLQLQEANSKLTQAQAELKEIQKNANKNAQKLRQRQQKIKEKEKEVVQLELKIKLMELGHLVSRYYTSTEYERAALKPDLEGAKALVINKFAGSTLASPNSSYASSYISFLFSQEGQANNDHLIRLLLWLQGEAKGNNILIEAGNAAYRNQPNFVSNHVNQLLQKLNPKDVYDCVNFVLNPTGEDEQTVLPDCMKYYKFDTISEKPSPTTGQIQSRHSYIRERLVLRSMLLEQLISDSTRNNMQLWDKIRNIDATPCDLFLYYATALSTISDQINKDNRYEPLRTRTADGINRDNIMVPLDRYHYARTYVLNAYMTACEILDKAAGDRKTFLIDEVDLLKAKKSAKAAVTVFLGQEKNEQKKVPRDDYHINAKPLVALLWQLQSDFDPVLKACGKPDFKTSFETALNKTYKKKEQITKFTAACPKERIKTASICSREAYVKDATRSRYAGKWFGNTTRSANEGEETWAGFVHYDEASNTIYVAYHGTDCWEDMKTDADAATIPCEFLGNLNTHRGFHNRYKATSEDMKDKLNDTIQNKVPAKNKAGLKIIVTGHSLGGALATLAALDLVNDAATGKNKSYKPSDIDLITFCSPRVISTDVYEKHIAKKGQEDKKSLLERSVRIWRRNDPVPAVPTGFMGYKHFGQSWCLDKAPDTSSLDPFTYHYMNYIQDDINKFLDNPNGEVKVYRITDEYTATSSSSQAAAAAATQ